MMKKFSCLLGLSLFLFGVTIENSWLAHYLLDHGFIASFVNGLFTVYGLLVALSSWLTYSFIQKMNFRRLILVSLAFCCVGSLLMVGGMTIQNQLWLVLGYLIRGTIYPLVAYSVLMWLMVMENKQRGLLVSLYWFGFGMGMNILAPFVSSFGFDERTLIFWSSLVAIVGVGLLLTMKPIQLDKGCTLLKQIGYLKGSKDLQRAVLIKAINNIAQYGFILILPLMLPIHLWTRLWSFTFVMNALATLIVGPISDRIGWKRVLESLAGPVTGLSCLLILMTVYYFKTPVWMLYGVFALFAFGIAAFAPLSALMPTLLPEDELASLSLLNLGSGLSNLLGPLLVSCIQSIGGSQIVMIGFAVLYFSVTTLSKNLNEKPIDADIVHVK